MEVPLPGLGAGYTGVQPFHSLNPKICFYTPVCVFYNKVVKDNSTEHEGARRGGTSTGKGPEQEKVRYKYTLTA